MKFLQAYIPQNTSFRHCDAIRYILISTDFIYSLFIYFGARAKKIFVIRIIRLTNKKNSR